MLRKTAVDPVVVAVTQVGVHHEVTRRRPHLELLYVLVDKHQRRLVALEYFQASVRYTLENTLGVGDSPHHPADVEKRVEAGVVLALTLGRFDFERLYVVADGDHAALLHR